MAHGRSGIHCSGEETYFVGLYVVQEIFQYANERSGTDSKTDKQKNVIFLVILCGCTIRAINKDLRKPKVDAISMLC